MTNYLIIGCSEYTIIPAQYAYLLKTDITDAQASILERKPLLNLWLISSVYLLGYFDVIFLAFGSICELKICHSHEVYEGLAAFVQK